jgi:ribose transport system substrate-binding protein
MRRDRATVLRRSPSSSIAARIRSRVSGAKISTLAGQGYDCFGVVPVNASNVITPLVPVARAKKTILNLDSQIDPAASSAAGVSYASFIGSDNIAAGTLAGQKMLTALGGGKVVILQGIAGEQNGINREKGFTEATPPLLPGGGVH